jgi:sulfatase maturation enzyme AslB (radical SAM superfamily)
MNYLDLSEITKIHFEHTSKCNLLCPQCARTSEDGKVNPYLPMGELTVDDYKKILTPSFAKQIEHVFWCGNYGDSIASNNFLECLEFVKSTGIPSISIVTNGSARNPDWWVKVANILNGEHDSIDFSLDGLEDTNHLYRVNSNWKKIKENVTAYIEAGGKAHWDYLIFDHNIHQVGKAKTYAKEMGFKSINFKNTSRFVRTDDFNKASNDALEVKSKKSTRVITSKQNENKTKYEKIIDKYGTFSDYVDATSISCKYKKRKQIYIDFEAKLWPCCWVGAPTYSDGKKNQQRLQLVALQERYHKDFNSLREHTLEEILEHEFYNRDLVDSWNNKMNSSNPKLFTCGRTCGDSYEFSSVGNFNEQRIRL